MSVSTDSTSIYYAIEIPYETPVEMESSLQTQLINNFNVDKLNNFESLTLYLSISDAIDDLLILNVAHINSVELRI